MPRKTATPQPKQKRGKGTTPAPRSSRRPTSPPRTPAEQEFRDKLKPCLPQERLFIRYRLGGHNNTEAARLAGYSEKSLEMEGTRLLGRARVYEAYQAGLAAAGFGPQDILADIRQLRNFDRSQIEREVEELTTVVVTRRAEDVIHDILKQERAVEDFMGGLDVDDEALMESFNRRLHQLLAERLELELQVAVNPDALTHVRETRTFTKRVIDYDRARDLGLLKFIKNVRPSKYGDIIETYDWMTGVEMGAKATGLFVERKVLSGPEGGPIQHQINYDELPPERIAEEYAKLLGQADDS